MYSSKYSILIFVYKCISKISLTNQVENFQHISSCQFQNYQACCVLALCTLCSLLWNIIYSVIIAFYDIWIPLDFLIFFVSIIITILPFHFTPIQKKSVSTASSVKNQNEFNIQNSTLLFSYSLFSLFKLTQTNIVLTPAIPSHFTKCSNYFLFYRSHHHHCRFFKFLPRNNLWRCFIITTTTALHFHP